MSETKEIWRQRVASWRASGETAERYSKRQGWSLGTLRWWSSRLGREARMPVVRMERLVRSSVPDEHREPASAIVVELLDARVRVIIYSGADRDAAIAVLESLASRVVR